MISIDKLRKNRSAAGFTLIELLVVMMIIAILAGLGAANYFQARKRGNDGKRAADLNSLRSALEMYYSDFHYYPDVGTWQTASGLAELVPDYIRAIPSDPTGVLYQYMGMDAGGGAEADCYCLSGKMEVATNGNTSPTGCSHYNGGAAYNYTLTCP